MSDCILDKHAPGNRGYPHIMRNGIVRSAHVWAWIDAHGPIPPGMLVCHHCDVRNCINVEHLFLGTHKDNMADMARKGRASRLGPINPSRGDQHVARRIPGFRAGERNGRAVITSKDAREIRDRYAAGGVSQQKLADEYGIKQPQVSRIILGTEWKCALMEE